MTDYSKFQEISPTAYADGLSRQQFMDIGIKTLWQPIPRIAGNAYTVKCHPGDNLMLHAAIYRAAPGAIIVVESGSLDYAMSGGNVCAIAQKRGIAGFVIDGVIRDVAEVRESKFPIFARGIMPKPGVKQTLGTLNEPITCGGVKVNPGDIIVADEEGIAVIPQADQDRVYEVAHARIIKETSETLEEWEAQHRAKVEQILRSKNFKES
ncbi:MAG: RraA family protein [Cyanobacteria bacterium P01_G01_bin.67]